MKKIISTPLGLILLWMGVCLVFGLFIPYITAGQDSSAEIPLVMGFYTVIGLVCGIFLISIFNMFYFKNSSKKSQYVNGSLTVITGCIVLYFIIKMTTL